MPRLLFTEWKISLVNCLYGFGSNIHRDPMSIGYCEFKNVLVNSELRDSLVVLLLKDSLLWQLGLPIDYPYC